MAREDARTPSIRTSIRSGRTSGLGRERRRGSVAFDQLAHEIEVGWRSLGKPTFDLLKSHGPGRALEMAPLGGRVHRVAEGLVAVAQGRPSTTVGALVIWRFGHSRRASGGQRQELLYSRTASSSHSLIHRGNTTPLALGVHNVKASVGERYRPLFKGEDGKVR